MGNRSLIDCCTLEGEGVDRITLVLSSEDEAAVWPQAPQHRLGHPGRHHSVSLRRVEKIRGVTP